MFPRPSWPCHKVKVIKMVWTGTLQVKSQSCEVWKTSFKHCKVPTKKFTAKFTFINFQGHLGRGWVGFQRPNLLNCSPIWPLIYPMSFMNIWTIKMTTYCNVIFIICLSQLWSYLPSDSQSLGGKGFPFWPEKSNFTNFQRPQLNFSFSLTFQAMKMADHFPQTFKDCKNPEQCLRKS